MAMEHSSLECLRSHPSGAQRVFLALQISLFSCKRLTEQDGLLSASIRFTGHEWPAVRWADLSIWKQRRIKNATEAMMLSTVIVKRATLMPRLFRFSEGPFCPNRTASLLLGLRSGAEDETSISLAPIRALLLAPATSSRQKNIIVKGRFILKFKTVALEGAANDEFPGSPNHRSNTSRARLQCSELQGSWDAEIKMG